MVRDGVEVKIGLVARAEDRGLGNLTWEWWRHMQPDRTLVVVPDTVQKAGLRSHLDRFNGGTRVGFDGGALDEKAVRGWLDGLDVVFSAETFYDWRMCRWAREQHVATVCMAMPEFTRHEWHEQPTQWWAPTSYRLKHLPPGTRVVPVPIPTDRWPTRATACQNGWPLRWLHIAGAQTIQDRNGTRAVMRALHRVTRTTRITIRTQTPVELGSTRPHVQIVQHDGNVRNYWRLYENADVLLMPRRYAGLCLPVLEAMGAGLPVVMSDMSPQSTDWPVAYVPTTPGAPIPLAGGMIETGDADPVALAELMDEWDRDRSLPEYAARRVHSWVPLNSWETRKPQIVQELAWAHDKL